MFFFVWRESTSGPYSGVLPKWDPIWGDQISCKYDVHFQAGAAISWPGTPRWNADGTRLGTGISKHLDFWPLDIYNLLHPQQRVDEDQAEMYEYPGQLRMPPAKSTDPLPQEPSVSRARQILELENVYPLTLAALNRARKAALSRNHPDNRRGRTRSQLRRHSQCCGPGNQPQKSCSQRVPCVRFRGRSMAGRHTGHQPGRAPLKPLQRPPS